MSRYLILLVVLVIAAAPSSIQPAVAQVEQPSSLHTDLLCDAFDAHPLLYMGELGPDTYVITWDGASIEVTVNGEAYRSVASLTDDERLLFEYPAGYGWLDVLDGNMRLDLFIGDADAYYGSADVEQAGSPAFIIVSPARRECVCKGSNTACSGGTEDCKNNQPCTTGGQGSKCIMAAVPEVAVWDPTQLSNGAEATDEGGTVVVANPAGGGEVSP